MPKISVIFSSYNYHRFIGPAIESILRQTMTDFEIVIVENGSTDGSGDVVRQYRDDRIHLIEWPENRGATWAYSEAIRCSSGKYIAVFSADDICAPERLEKQVQHLEANPEVAAVFCIPEVIDDNGGKFERAGHFYVSGFEAKNQTSDLWLRRFFFYGNCLCFPSMMVRTNILRDLGGFNITYEQLSDFEFLIRLCMQHTIHILSEPLVRFRVHENEGNSSGARPENTARTITEHALILQLFSRENPPDNLTKAFPEIGKSEWDSFESRSLAFVRLVGNPRSVSHWLFVVDLLHRCLTRFNPLFPGDSPIMMLMEVKKELLRIGGTPDHYANTNVEFPAEIRSLAAFVDSLHDQIGTQRCHIGAQQSQIEMQQNLIGELRRIVESAENWQQRSWFKRAFHRWRSGEGKGERPGFLQRLERSIRKKARRLAETLLRRPSVTGKGSNSARLPEISPERAKLLARNARDSELDVFLRTETEIQMPLCTKPKLSVLIVLYNQAGFTYACLRPLEQEREVSCEVIIVDNASKDRTGELLDKSKGLKILRNAENVGFVRAVNQAAAQACGEYILLLNNDAVIRPGSLAAAIRAIESSSDIGAVGGRLILPCGTLQEAGSIVWNDGSCLGYGRGLGPDDYQVLFRRDVDYCSGAFLLIRRTAFEKLGGLDEAFSPAYYEEVDFCMRLWATGLRVVYEPGIVVDHFEFASSTQSEDAIALQLRNRELFCTKHTDALATRFKPDSANILRARHQNHRQKRVLFIDDQIPIPAAGSGLPRAREMAESIVRAGYGLTLYPLQSPDEHRDAARGSLPADIEIAFGEGVAGLKAFLETRRGSYDVILVSRPHNMKVVAQIRASSPQLFDGTRTWYDAEALFAARTICAARLHGKPLDEGAAALMIAKETSLAETADVISVVSPLEARYFSEQGRQNVHILKHCLPLRPSPAGFHERNNFLFVGRLLESESPNADSVLWFVREILPLIQRRLGKAVGVSVIGMIGSALHKQLSHPAVTVLGEVDDLTEFYDRSRVFIAPTRFSAGVPLKVLEAASHGLPAVCTTLLAQQLDWENGVDILAAGTLEEFAEACIRAYTDQALWQQLRINSLNRIAAECSVEHFYGTICAMLEKDRIAATPQAV
ncbi:MAG: glycosyltransferase [Chthoniobacteraceae bacterium]